MTITKGFLDSKDRLYKFCDLSRLDTGLTALIAQANEQNKIWHERLEHLNFHNLKLMVTQDMVSILPKLLPFDGVCKGCVLGKHH